MENVKHTPGPWNIYVNSQDDLVIRKMFPDGQESHSIARCHSGFANARRIVACVNACEGISTENLEENLPVKELAIRYNDALGQRDELLEAARLCVAELRAWMNCHGEDLQTISAIKASNAAISKVTGGA